MSLISGGNIDVVTISSLINKGLISRGRIYCFSVDLPDTPGQLLQISKILSDFIASLDIPSEAKKELNKLTPMNYIGDAIKLARNI